MTSVIKNIKFILDQTMKETRLWAYVTVERKNVFPILQENIPTLEL